MLEWWHTTVFFGRHSAVTSPTPGFIARYYMILFRCLVTLRIRGKSVGRVSFDTGNNRLLERDKTDAYSSF